MHCKSLWIKASAKCKNVNLNVNKLTFHPHSGPRFTRNIALAQNQLSKITSLVQMYCVSHIILDESCRRTIISSSVLKSDVSERNSSTFSVLHGDPKIVATDS